MNLPLLNQLKNALTREETSTEEILKSTFQIKSLLDIAVQRPRLEKKDPLESELRHFLQCVRDGKAPLVSGSHGRDALELALEIRRSLRLHSL
ncbi:MAG TPA: hypothetical protein PLO76_03305 [Elusimicrobiota bacterium]|nr:hypothetical protein [Elusimicrobiota bacterium]